MASYLMLISIVGVFLQVLFADAVRNLFVEYETPVVYSSPWVTKERWASVKQKSSNLAKRAWHLMIFWRHKKQREPNPIT